MGDAFVDKPIDEDLLMASIRRLIARDRSMAGPSDTVGRAGPADDEPLVMVVDDDPSIRRYLAQIMENEGYRVTEAENGRCALELAQGERPSLITMDLRMPDMDGKTAIGLFKADRTLRQIPIIVGLGSAGRRACSGRCFCLQTGR